MYFRADIYRLLLWTETASKAKMPKDFVALNECCLGTRQRRYLGCERCSWREFTVVLWELWTIAEALEIDNDTEDDSVNNKKAHNDHTKYDIQLYNKSQIVEITRIYLLPRERQ